MRIVNCVVLALALALAIPAGAEVAKPPLRDVPEIENTLFAIAVANEVRRKCSSINGRMFRGMRLLHRLRARANDLGYSDDEIRAHVESDVEKARMRAKGHRLLQANGVVLDDPESFCAFGHAEIARSSAIGTLLWAR